MCKWGVGRFDAEVVVMEGHRKHWIQLVLRCSATCVSMCCVCPNNLYWIPLKENLVVVIVTQWRWVNSMRSSPRQFWFLVWTVGTSQYADRQSAESGQEYRVELNSSSVPAVCTHHQSLLEDPHNK